MFNNRIDQLRSIWTESKQRDNDHYFFEPTMCSDDYCPQESDTYLNTDSYDYCQS